MGPTGVPKVVRRYRADAVVLYGLDINAVQRNDDADAIWFQSAYQDVKDYPTDGLMTSVYFLKGSSHVLLDPPRPHP